MSGLNLLLIADTHAVDRADWRCPLPGRRSGLGIEFLRRALACPRSAPPPDVILLAGDLVDNGGAPGAGEDLRALGAAAAAAGVPVLAVPGNHDGPPDDFFAAVGGRPGPFAFGDYLFYVFADTFAADGAWARRPEDLEAFAAACRAHPGRRVVVLQHAPVYPLLAGAYPYNPSNHEAVHRAYAEQGVMLSLSGHYHPGTPLSFRDGVGYLSAPALCEAPFAFFRLRLEGASASAERRCLRLPPGLHDNHCHSRFAWCAEDVDFAPVAERAAALGLEQVCFTEHSGQLYLSADDYWSGRYFSEPHLLRAARAAGRDRVGDYRRACRAHAAPGVAFGLEVETDRHGELTLLPEDRAGWDLLVGAVHCLGPRAGEGPGPAMERLFLDACARLLENGVDVLAHPFRFLGRTGRAAPRNLFRPLVRLLSDHGTAVELNFHHNEPAPEFFGLCLESGIPVSLGSDAHNLMEVGDFSRHLDFLARLGVGDPAAVLFRKQAAAGCGRAEAGGR